MTVRKLVAAFHECVNMEDGSLSYPYSTRELVNMVRHMEAFPNDGISVVLRNIFDFDKFRGDEREVLVEAFRRQGIVLDSDVKLEVKLGIVTPLPPVSLTEKWVVGDVRQANAAASVATTKPIELPISCVVGTISYSSSSSSTVDQAQNVVEPHNFERFDLRAEIFGEAEFSFRIPGQGNICDAIVLDSGRIILARHHIGKLELQMVDMDTDTVISLGSKFVCPPVASTSGIFRPSPPNMALAKLSEERFLVHNPRDHGLSMVDIRTGEVRHFIIPFDETSNQKKKSHIVVSASLNENLVACSSQASTKFIFCISKGVHRRTRKT